MTQLETVCITGASGFLGAHLLAEAGKEHRAFGVARHVVPGGDVRVADLLEPGRLEALLRSARPDAVIHAAAWASVEACRLDPRGARRMNADVPRALASTCHALGTRLIHVSTDLVFDGEHAPYGEEDEARPTSVYGEAKRRGERAVLAAHPDALVVRLPLLYGNAIHAPGGATAALLRAVAENLPTSLFVDEWRSPLAVDFVAACLVALVDRDVCGILHLGSVDAISRYELGLALAERLGIDRGFVQPACQVDVRSNELRPRDVSLNVARARSLGFELPTAREGVARWQPRTR